MTNAERATSRRSLMRTVAWATPATVATVSAPALAVSACLPSGVQGFPTAGTEGNGWVIAENGEVTSGTTEFSSTYGSGGFGTLYSFAEPAPGATYVATATSPATLVAGREYELVFTYNIRRSEELPITGRFLVGDTEIPGSAVSSDVGDGTLNLRVETTFTMPSPAPASLSIEFQVSNPTAAEATANDLRFRIVTLTCL